jgi:NAD+ kinase
MRTPRIRIVSRYKSLGPVVDRIRKEAEARGITVNDKSYDVAIAVGGDGTMISAAVGGKPVMTVRGGSKNHLLDIPQDRIGAAFDMLLAGKFKEERYSMLEVTARKKNVLAFNDIGITSIVPLPIGFTVSYLGTGFEASGDGVLVSTPQGSTGWSFSSNGTYLSHRSNVFLISLLNPVMMPLRSVVIPQVPVRLEVDTKDHRDRATLVADGNIIIRLDDGESVSVRKSRKEAVIYRFFEHELMRTMLGNGSSL